ncbi:MAG: exodeoxyribonuclease V subunit alpha [Pigmentiphaga sp.]|uniref:exodeoxyribonuclease V subunit alpha n=1 Tax=Pigmentiphaga sp. TaxID=1977564 RepID=UPI0029B81B58|nr:exodeoxyribonuclease V subunit alpha [Pigmentiphaga sp.]MDX3905437.1 exodeoxyribonuclease V subunit alpha [Pigmentiphaga sp.]
MSQGPLNYELPFDAPAQPPGHLHDTRALLGVLDNWVERGWLRRLDRAFVGFLCECDPEAAPLVVLAAALASHQLGHGHVCLDLALTLERSDEALSLPPEGDASPAMVLPSDLLSGLDVAHWRSALAESPLVASPADAAGSDNGQPLVLDGGRLYLRRYWDFEQRIAQALRQRLAQPPVSPPALSDALARLFGPPQPDAPRPDWQKLACALAARGNISIITGGPGTGKTTTVVRLLALLQMAAHEQGRPLRVLLAASTGKAAARLSASIAEQVGRLPVPEPVRATIPTDVSTLHRLLGSRQDSRHFRHHAGNPLPVDMLVVDEASMVDVEMMAHLMAALPAHARLVLLGDKDQLASVEAGAVLGDLCRDAEAGRYTRETLRWLEEASGESLAGAGLLPGDAASHAMAQQTVMLRHSRRFGAGSGIGKLARAVNSGDPREVRQVIADEAASRDPGVYDVCGLKPDALDRLLLDGHAESDRGRPRGYAYYLERMHQQRPPAGTPADDPVWESWAAEVLAAFDQFRLLCAVRKGEQGVEALNARIARALCSRGLIEQDHGWYEGRPVLVTRNDYGLGLMNGDIGIALRVPQAGGGMPSGTALRVAFLRSDGAPGVRFALPSRLSAVETVYAMTVHKSQGSEFAHTALALPAKASPLLTRELVYTGVTRARTWFTLIEAQPGILEEAITRRVRRISGLRI